MNIIEIYWMYLLLGEWKKYVVYLLLGEWKKCIAWHWTLHLNIHLKLNINLTSSHCNEIRLLQWPISDPQAPESSWSKLATLGFLDLWSKLHTLEPQKSKSHPACIQTHTIARRYLVSYKGVEPWYHNDNRQRWIHRILQNRKFIYDRLSVTGWKNYECVLSTQKRKKVIKLIFW